VKRTWNESGMTERNLGWVRMSGGTCDFRINESAGEIYEAESWGGWAVSRGPKVFTSVEFRLLFAERVRRGEENLTGQWILSLDF